jgi:hypothetical protein
VVLRWNRLPEPNVVGELSKCKRHDEGLFAVSSVVVDMAMSPFFEGAKNGHGLNDGVR